MFFQWEECIGDRTELERIIMHLCTCVSCWFSSLPREDCVFVVNVPHRVGEQKELRAQPNVNSPHILTDESALTCRLDFPLLKSLLSSVSSFLFGMYFFQYAISGQVLLDRGSVRVPLISQGVFHSGTFLAGLPSEKTKFKAVPSAGIHTRVPPREGHVFLGIFYARLGQILKKKSFCQPIRPERRTFKEVRTRGGEFTSQELGGNAGCPLPGPEGCGRVDVYAALSRAPRWGASLPTRSSWSLDVGSPQAGHPPLRSLSALRRPALSPRRRRRGGVCRGVTADVAVGPGPPPPPPPPRYRGTRRGSAGDER